VGKLSKSSKREYNSQLYGGDMTDIESELLDIVTQIRAHLEYQKALGVSLIESIPPSESGIASPAPLTSAGKAAEPAVPKPSQASAGLSAIREELGDCIRCKLHRGRTNIVFGEGNPKAVLVFVGEGPGQEEDQQGRPFVGAAGQLLTDIIVKGMKVKREDVYICNIVKCRPPDNRNPEPDEVEACEPFLKKQLAAINPAVIVALGNTAVKTLLKTPEGITSLRGKWQTYQGIPLMPTFHPAYLLRNPSGKKLVWEDIQQVMKKLGMQAKG
jgi:uracil-DNA glycosylase